LKLPLSALVKVPMVAMSKFLSLSGHDRRGLDGDR
jgi:hypothetical protein